MSCSLALLQAADASPEGTRLLQRYARERVRLLYVGFTRARDLLVLVTCIGLHGPRAAALEPLRGANGRPVLRLPLDAPRGKARVRVGGKDWTCLSRHLSGLPVEPGGSQPVQRRWYDAAARRPRPLEILNPSTEPTPVALGQPRIVEVVKLGDRVELRASADEMAGVGDAVHAFMAADGGGDPLVRTATAARLLTAYGVALAIDPGALIHISDALTEYLSRRYSGAVWHKEWPVRARMRDADHARLLVGQIDLLLELKDGFVLVDHKSFPGTEAARDERVLAHAVQLAFYALAVGGSLRKPLLAAFIHLPVRGELVELDLRDTLARFEAQHAPPDAKPRTMRRDLAS